MSIWYGKQRKTLHNRLIFILGTFEEATNLNTPYNSCLQMTITLAEHHNLKGSAKQQANLELKRFLVLLTSHERQQVNFICRF